MPPKPGAWEPDQLSSAGAITAALTTRRLGRPVLFLQRVGSTNDVARQMAAGGAADGLLVVADEQTAGRGRLNRSWWAPPGSSLLMSILLRPSIPLSRAGQLTMCLGLGAVEGIEEMTGLHPALKWPNDLVLSGRKLGGMLTELEADGERLAYAVVGLGLNVSWHDERAEDKEQESGDGDSLPGFHRPSAFGIPADIAVAAISLSTVLGRPVNRLPLLARILACCEKWYERFLAEQTDPKLNGRAVHQAWAARLETLGRAVTVTMDEVEVQGDAIGVNAEGALLVRDEKGRVHTVWTGDVTSVRPGGKPAPPM